MVITIHQPEHLPWLGLIDKIDKADTFVVLDTVQFEKNNFQNRNRIRTNSDKGFSWLTIPLKKQSLDTRIREIEISYRENSWESRYLNIVKENYRKSPYFNKYFEILSSTINAKKSKLVDLNMELLTFLLDEFNVSTKVVKASELNISDVSGGNQVVTEICEKLGSKTYISGSGGKAYLDLNLFKEKNIEVIFQEFVHPQYNQQYTPFISHMSSIDFLFNEGASKAAAALRKNFE